MDLRNQALATQDTTAPNETAGSRMAQWIQDPMGSVVTASVSTIGSFGIVVAGIWFISLTVN